jgi:hypothetical protein
MAETLPLTVVVTDRVTDPYLALFPDQICTRVTFLLIALFRLFLHDTDPYFRWPDPSFNPIVLQALFHDCPLDFSLFMSLFLLHALQ